jgi:hypothetical protein
MGFEDTKGLAREPIKRTTRMNENNQHFLSMSKSFISTSTRCLNLHILRKLTFVAERRHLVYLQARGVPNHTCPQNGAFTQRISKI